MQGLIELLRFILSDFWNFAGTCFLIYTTGLAIHMSIHRS